MAGDRDLQPCVAVQGLRDGGFRNSSGSEFTDGSVPGALVGVVVVGIPYCVERKNGEDENGYYGEDGTD
jgi:hypothetical protein